MGNFFRYFVFSLLFCLGPACLAQELTVRLIDVANGQPMQKQSVSVSFLYDKKYDKSIPEKYDRSLKLETDVNGEAHFRFPEPPPAHFSTEVRLDWSRWHCGCGILASTDDLIGKGIAGPVPTSGSATSAALFKAVPGQILLVARPLSFWERLIYPLEKE